MSDCLVVSDQLRDGRTLLHIAAQKNDKYEVLEYEYYTILFDLVQLHSIGGESITQDSKKVFSIVILHPAKPNPVTRVSKTGLIIPVVTAMAKPGMRRAEHFTCGAGQRRNSLGQIQAQKMIQSILWKNTHTIICEGGKYLSGRLGFLPCRVKFGKINIRQNKHFREKLR